MDPARVGTNYHSTRSYLGRVRFKCKHHWATIEQKSNNPNKPDHYVACRNCGYRPKPL